MVLTLEKSKNDDTRRKPTVIEEERTILAGFMALILFKGKGM